MIWDFPVFAETHGAFQVAAAAELYINMIRIGRGIINPWQYMPIKPVAGIAQNASLVSPTIQVFLKGRLSDEVVIDFHGVPDTG
ncbi:MAG: hypothetical protein QGF71_03710 [Rhodospirillales bacterium]|nr:hypothetical protein [Rhodospirillales bacterium]